MKSDPDVFADALVPAAVPWAPTASDFPQDTFRWSADGAAASLLRAAGRPLPRQPMAAAYKFAGDGYRSAKPQGKPNLTIAAKP